MRLRRKLNDLPALTRVNNPLNVPKDKYQAGHLEASDDRKQLLLPLEIAIVVPKKMEWRIICKQPFFYVILPAI